MPPRNDQKKKWMRKPWGKHVFLNSPIGADDGWLHGRITYGYRGSPSVNLVIGDCTRVITLEFSPGSGSGQDRKARIKKIKKLRRVVNAFCDEAESALTVPLLPDDE